VPRGCCRCAHRGWLDRSTRNDTIEESQPSQSNDSRRQLDLRSRGVAGGIRRARLPDAAVFRWVVRAPPIHTAAAHTHHSCSMLCKTAPSASRSDRSLTTSRGERGRGERERTRASNALHSAIMTGGNALNEARERYLKRMGQPSWLLGSCFITRGK
jgi:hypothetical protein